MRMVLGSQALESPLTVLWKRIADLEDADRARRVRGEQAYFNVVIS